MLSSIVKSIKEKIEGFHVGSRGQGVLGILPDAASSIGVTALILAVIALVLVSFGDSTTNTSVKYIVGNATDAFVVIAKQFGTLGIVIVGAVMLALVTLFLGSGGSRGGRRK